jgi:hypothetical protein
MKKKIKILLKLNIYNNNNIYINNMKICFFGASVTEQGYKNGFVPQFKNILEENQLNNVEIIQKGFGSTHLFDAGICKIDEIISENPNYTFIDWFSTGYIETNCDKLEIYLNVIIRKLMLIKSNICFLLFDKLDMCERRLNMYDLIINYANQYNIHYIKLYNNSNVKELLRDDVHTNEVGAKFYAGKIYDYFTKNMCNKDIKYTNIPNENEYSIIKTLKIDRKITDKIVLFGNFKLMGIYQTIGNFSGIVEIIKNNEYKSFYNIWDKWCYFQRKNIQINSYNEYVNNFEISVTQNTFDTSLCKENVDFSFYEKYIYIYEIYYLGELNME